MSAARANTVLLTGEGSRCLFKEAPRKGRLHFFARRWRPLPPVQDVWWRPLRLQATQGGVEGGPCTRVALG